MAHPANPPVRIMAEHITPTHMSVVDAEVMTGVSRWTWRQMAYRGIVESCKIGVGRNARLLIPISEVKRVLRESTRPRVETTGKKSA